MKFMAGIKAAINRVLPQQSFVRHVSVLAGGTAMAQAIGVLALPLITRLYTPADFSVLAVYSSILAIVAGVACLRLDIAVPLPARDEDAANLLAVALACCTMAAGLAAVAIWVAAEQIVKAVGQPGLQPYLWMIPLGIWLTGAYSAVQFWATRKKRFAAIAKTRVAQTASSAMAQMGFGMWGALGPFGLLLGQLLSSGAGVFGLGRTAWRKDRQALRQVAWADMCRVFRAHDRFPKYSTFESFANNGAIELPVIIIAAVALGPEAGYLFLAMKAMAIPLSLIGGAVSQVYLSRAPDELRAGQLAPFTLKAIAGLARAGTGPLLFAGLAAPAVFPWVFGAEWQRAGEMVAWMTPWFILQFLSSPVSMSLHVTGNQRIALILQVFGLVVRVGATGFAALFASAHVFEFYAASGVVFYAAYLLAVAHVTKMNGRDLWRALAARPQTTLVWVITGLAVAGAAAFVPHPF